MQLEDLSYGSSILSLSCSGGGRHIKQGRHSWLALASPLTGPDPQSTHKYAKKKRVWLCVNKTPLTKLHWATDYGCPLPTLARLTY